MDFYNLFSYSAKKAIYRASGICTQFKNKYLEPEHILYSILDLSYCTAVELLRRLGVTLPKLLYSLEAYLYENVGSFEGQASFSARTLALLDLAFKESKRMHHREIGTAHLLIALTQLREPFLEKLFGESSLGADQIRAEFIRGVKGYEGSEPYHLQAAELKTTRAHGAVLPPRIPEEYKQYSYFSGPLNNVLYSARRLALKFQHGEVTPAHLLYALLAVLPNRELDDVTMTAIFNAGQLMAALLAHLAADYPTVKYRARLSPPALEAFTQAFREAFADESPQIELKHFLPALANMLDDPLAHMLSEHGCYLPGMLQPGFRLSPEEERQIGAIVSELEANVEKVEQLSEELEAEAVQEQSAAEEALEQPDAADETPPAGS